MNIKSKRVTVPTPGTRVPLSASHQPVEKVVIQALGNNTNAVTVGDITVVGATATRIGIALDTDSVIQQTDVLELCNVDLIDVYIDVITANDGVSIVYTF